MKLAEIEREYAAEKAAFHEAATTENVIQLAEREERIGKLYAAMNDVLVAGAEGDNLIGMKRPAGVPGFGTIHYFEIGDGTNRSQGETQEQAAENWNNGVFVVKDVPTVAEIAEGVIEE